MSEMETRGFNPVTFLRNAARNSPWIVMAVALHLIIGAIGLIAYSRSHDTGANDESIGVQLAKPKDKPDDAVIPPEIIDRKSIPKNEEAEIVPYEEDVYIPQTEVQEDLHLEHRDPNAMDNNPPGATGGTAIGVGDKGHGGTRPSPFSTRRLGGGGKPRSIHAISATKNSGAISNM